MLHWMKTLIWKISPRTSSFEKFMKKIKINGKSIDVDFHQARLLKYYRNDEKLNLSILPRQFGKTTTATAHILWKAMNEPNMKIAFVARNRSQCDEFMHYLKSAYENLPFMDKIGMTHMKRYEIEFDNHSSIHAMSSHEAFNRTRAACFNFLYLDDFKSFDPKKSHELWNQLNKIDMDKIIVTTSDYGDDDPEEPHAFDVLWNMNSGLDMFGLRR